jgi:hypothetical protein
MKRLLWLICLIYTVPLTAAISIPAHADNLANVKSNKQQAARKSGLARSSQKSKFFTALQQGQPVDPSGPPGAPPPTDSLPAPSETIPPPAGATPSAPPNVTPPDVTPPNTVPSPVSPAFPEAPATPATSGGVPSSSAPTVPGSIDEAEKLRTRLDGISRQEFDIRCPCYGPLSPALTLSNPSGFGADNNTLFLSGSYQSRTRFNNRSDGELGFGVGLGDARNSIGAELSYSINSFGSSQSFGSGGFNVKLHKLLDDDLGVAIGWNRFLSVGDQSDFPNNSYYLAATKVFSTTNEVDSFLSRIALTAGVGGGQFQSESALFRGENGLNVFGSLGFRLAKPLSAVVEWTGQDLAAGLSYVPFEGFPLVITPSFRDITGAGDGARFVLGTGIQFNF